MTVPDTVNVEPDNTVSWPLGVVLPCPPAGNVTPGSSLDWTPSPRNEKVALLPAVSVAVVAPSTPR